MCRFGADVGGRKKRVTLRRDIAISLAPASRSRHRFPVPPISRRPSSKLHHYQTLSVMDIYVVLGIVCLYRMCADPVGRGKAG